MRATHAKKNIYLDPCNYVIACFLDRWQEKSLFLKLLVVDVVTSATFAIGKFSKNNDTFLSQQQPEFVSSPSTGWARCYLTLVIGQELVHST